MFTMTATVAISHFFASRLFLVVMTYLVAGREDCGVFVANSGGRMNSFNLHSCLRLFHGNDSVQH